MIALLYGYFTLATLISDELLLRDHKEQNGEIRCRAPFIAPIDPAMSRATALASPDK